MAACAGRGAAEKDRERAASKQHHEAGDGCLRRPFAWAGAG